MLTASCFYLVRFHFPPTPPTAQQRAGRPNCVYLCGNSLGLQPRKCPTYVNAELVKWQRRGVEGHFPATIYEKSQPLPWVTVDETCVESLARVVGALPVEVATMNSLSSNLHFMMVSCVIL